MFLFFANVNQNSIFFFLHFIFLHHLFFKNNHFYSIFSFESMCGFFFFFYLSFVV
ncbi:hypothetical protein DFH28DRAFT_957917 [Melampsora americana]|nr:hypothetical protein DFH28DRAFT_957917 [Melampsora americana]